MSHCPDEPDGEALYSCQKHEIRMAAGSLRCRDTEIYCKFRSACAVYFLTHRRRGLDDDPPACPDGQAPDDQPAGGSDDAAH
jgi:hypothetical protein